MSNSGIPNQIGFRELVFSDLARYRPAGAASWSRVAALCLTTPGMLASLVLRAQQVLYRSGRTRSSGVLRSVGVMLVGADFGPGMQVGTGLMLAHPAGVTIGFGLRIGNNVTFAGGATAAARYYDAQDAADARPAGADDSGGGQQFATICDGAVIGAHAVLVGGVRVGRNAMVGANTVVLSDVADNAVVLGNPARQVGTREPG
jgi:serine O-acetyltransferase